MKRISEKREKLTILEQIQTKHVVPLFVLFIGALLVRLVSLGVEPKGFHVDELNAGYVGRYILLNGHDIFGTVLPTFFNKLGDYRPIGIFYLSGLATFIFGINEFAVRFPAAFFGALTVFPIYLLSTLLSGSKRIGYIAAFLLVFTPWHIVTSRATSESVIGLFFVLLGIWFFLSGILKKYNNYLYYGTILLGTSYFFYHSYRLLVPFSILLIALLHRKQKVQKRIWVITLSFFLLSFAIGITNIGGGRLQQVVFYKNPSLIHPEENLGDEGTGNQLLFVRLFHNKALFYTTEFIKQYYSYFSPDYLFLSGGFPDRYRIPNQGLFLPLLFPFFIIGLFYYLRKAKNPVLDKLPILMLFLLPLPAAITYEDVPNIQRSLMLLYPILFFISVGFNAVYLSLQNGKRTTLLNAFVFSVITLILVFEFSSFEHSYFYHADTVKGIYRNDGNRELFEEIKKSYGSVDHVVLPLYDELPMYAAFYLNFFHAFPAATYGGSPNSEHIDKMLFVNTKCPNSKTATDLSGKILLITYDQCLPPEDNFQQLSTIRRKDGTVAYSVYLLHK